MSISAIEKLLDRYLSGECSAEEQLMVESWLENQAITENEWTKMIESEKNAWISSLRDKINQTIKEKNTVEVIKVKIVPLYKRTVFRAAAAILFIMFGIWSWYYYQNEGQKETAITEKNIPLKNDILPGSNKAILTLADGSIILLDSARNGLLAQQSGTQVLKTGTGQLAYNTSKDKPAEILYNSISTPRGGQYQLTLPDGSQVWLNAASYIRFPVAFAGKERKVEITGEAYFEVIKNKNLPFRVTANDVVVEVMGTHFNINAYNDAATLNTTLLEGSVKVIKGNSIKVLTPGQQAQVNAGGEITLKKEVNIDEVVAWKNGWFNFDRADLRNIMSQISRWYDVNVIYEGKMNEIHLSGVVSRNNKVSEVLKMMENAGIKFRIEGKTITVIQ
jgi:transmembrane sensor